MKIVTIIENNPITGVRYGTMEIPEYNNNIQRRIESANRFYNQVKRATYKKTNHKTYNG